MSRMDQPPSTLGDGERQFGLRIRIDDIELDDLRTPERIARMVPGLGRGAASRVKAARAR